MRCSNGKQGPGEPDPGNKCGDALPPPPTCPGGGQPSPPDASTKLQAFSEPEETYSRITFCDDFFKLQTLSVQTENMRSRPASVRDNMANWDNQARVFLHEMTHLEYFINAPRISPLVHDLEIEYTDRGQRQWFTAYGPANAKILRNWVDPDPQYSGYFTQRNADNYAWYAMGRWILQQTNEYPSRPRLSRRVLSEPRDANTHEEPQNNGGSTPQGTSGLEEHINAGDPNEVPLDIRYPGCSGEVRG